VQLLLFHLQLFLPNRIKPLIEELKIYQIWSKNTQLSYVLFLYIPFYLQVRLQIIILGIIFMIQALLVFSFNNIKLLHIIVSPKYIVLLNWAE